MRLGDKTMPFPVSSCLLDLLAREPGVGQCGSIFCEEGLCRERSCETCVVRASAAGRVVRHDRVRGVWKLFPSLKDCRRDVCPIPSRVTYGSSRKGGLTRSFLSLMYLAEVASGWTV
ncbi:unnamed protein product, partial [Ectocarpus sp. 12 AP-2014]